MDMEHRNKFLVEQDKSSASSLAVILHDLEHAWTGPRENREVKSKVFADVVRVARSLMDGRCSKGLSCHGQPANIFRWEGGCLRMQFGRQMDEGIGESSFEPQFVCVGEARFSPPGDLSAGE